MVELYEKIYLVIFGSLGIFPTLVYLIAFLVDSIKISFVISSLIYTPFVTWFLIKRFK